MKKMKIPNGAEALIDRLESAGFEAYLVGGCVRDMIMSKEPNDYDITTSATPAQMKECLGNFRTLDTGLKHGTLTVLVDGESYETTTFRVDGEYLDNRRPSEVFFTTRIEDDLSRRDFTVNAMAYSPARGVIDLFGGRQDIERRIIRAVGDPDRRFEEDGLRILRALRFASVLDFEIDRETAQSIHRKAHLLDNISAERIFAELCKLICGRSAARIMLEFSDVICRIIPELGPTVGFDQKNPYHIYDVYTHTAHALAACPARADKYVRLAILFHDAGKPASFSEDERGGHFYGHHKISAELAHSALCRLKSDGRTRHLVVKLVDAHDRDIRPTMPAVRRLVASFGVEDTRRLLDLRRADNSALVGWLIEQRLAEIDEIERLVDEICAEDACLSLKTLAVHGGDLIGIGYAPGKSIGKVLSALLEAVIEGEVANERDALLEMARGMMDGL